MDEPLFCVMLHRDGEAVRAVRRHEEFDAALDYVNKFNAISEGTGLCASIYPDPRQPVSFAMRAAS